MNFLPRFVRRRVLLKRARELVGKGEAQVALSILADPLFDGVPAARELARVAEERLKQGENGMRTSITDLLARMREERARRGVEASEKGPVEPVAAPGPPTRSGRAGRALTFRLAVDDAGEYLVAIGEDFTIGHESSTRADLRFLAHVEREHARLVFTNDFHAGPTWRVVPIGALHATVRGREVATSGAVLVDGDRVVLGQNLAFHFRAEELSSSSVVLELEHGIECQGAGRLLLFVSGAAGRVTIGSSSKRPIRAGGLEHAVSLEVSEVGSDGSEARLAVACTAGIARGVRPGEGAPTSLSILVPPRASERFTFGARARTEAPFEVVVAPSEESTA